MLHESAQLTLLECIGLDSIPHINVATLIRDRCSIRLSREAASGSLQSAGICRIRGFHRFRRFQRGFRHAAGRGVTGH